MTTETKEKVAPNSKDSEMMVLGCMLTSVDHLNISSEELDDYDFYYTEHKLIFQVLKTAYKNNKPADVHLVCEELKRLNKLKAVGGAAYVTTLAQYAGTSAYIEEYVKIVKDQSILRTLLDISKNLENSALDNPKNADKLIEDFSKQIKYLENVKNKKIQTIPIAHRINSHKETIEKYRGKKYLGLCVKTIQEINYKMLGLRKLILLAAAPNVGKTALTIQLANEALLMESDACLVYVSLEMDAEEIFTRMNLYFSELDFNTYVLGSQQNEVENHYQNFFSEEELRKISKSTKSIEEIGDRLQIIDLKTYPNISADIIIDYVNRLKNETKCHRAIVVVDYLQVLPIPPHIRFTSDIEADKWRIGEIKRIRDALNKENQDPVIVISEARKPSESNGVWGNDLSDVMGSARGTYTPDAVLLLNPLSAKQVKTLWDSMKMPPDLIYKGDVNDIEDANDPSNIKGFLAHHGIVICSLKMPKGRDGMKKFNILLAFHFHRNKFEAVNWNWILGLAMEEKNKNKKQKNV